MLELRRNRRSQHVAIVGLFALAALTLLGAPFVGIRTIPLDAAFSPFSEGVDSYIFWQLRVPRVATSFLSGSALAVSGMVFQAIFRNPLTTPFTLGVASGASLGATIYIRVGLFFSVLGFSGISLAAFGGALASIFMVYSLTRIRGGFSTTTMLLSGVAISFFFSSLIFFTQYLSDFTQSFRILRWLMGSMEATGYETVLDILPVVVGGCAVVTFLANELNLMSTGEEEAISRGVDTKKTKLVLFVTTSLMVGCVVAVCGPIGFVGMMAPHICRLITGPNHRSLIPATIIFGGVFLTMCDSLARVLVAPAEIPVGIITALLGGPFFIWLLLSKSTSLDTYT